MPVLLTSGWRRLAPWIASLLLAACGGGGGGGSGGEAPPAPPPVDPILAAATAYGSETTPAGASSMTLAEFKAWAGNDRIAFASKAEADAAVAAGEARHAANKALVDAAIVQRPALAALVNLPASAPDLTTARDGTRHLRLDADNAVTLMGSREAYADVAAGLRLTNQRANVEATYLTLIEHLPRDQREGLPDPAALAAVSDGELQLARLEVARRVEAFNPSDEPFPRPGPTQAGVSGGGSSVARILGSARSEAVPGQARRLAIQPFSDFSGCGAEAPSYFSGRYNWAMKASMTPIRRQSSRGTCVAFGVVAGVESYARHWQDQLLNLSEQEVYGEALYSWFRKSDDYGEGISTADTIEELRSRAWRIDFESAWRYNASLSRVENDDTRTYSQSCKDYDDPACSDTNHQRQVVCTKSNGATYCAYKLPPSVTNPSSDHQRITGTVSLWNGLEPENSLAAVKAMLSAGKPVVMSFNIDSAFKTASGMTDVRLPGVVLYDPDSPVKGGHAMLAVGHLPNGMLRDGDRDPSGGYLVLKNSWGCSSGDQGMYYVPYSWVIDRTKSATAITGATGHLTTPQVTLSLPSAVIKASGAMDFKVSSNLRISKIEIYVAQVIGPVITRSYTVPVAGPVTITPQVPDEWSLFAEGIGHASARVYDEGGNMAYSNEVGFIKDTQAPTITLATSTPAIATPGTVHLDATAADESGIAKVDFFLGLTKIATRTSAPFSADYPLAKLDIGQKVFIALATDKAGRYASSNVVTVQAATVLKPLVLSFTATPDLLPFGGGRATLNWKVGGTGTVNIDHGVGTQPSEGSAVVDVGTTTSFTLTASNSAGTTTGQALVAVQALPAPQIQSFAATPASVPFGGGNTTLSWSFLFGTPTSVVITPDVGDVTGLSSKTVNVMANTTYTLTASNAAGTRTRTLTVEVGADTTPPSVSLAASATSVTSAADLKLSASASDNAGVTRVDFYRGATLLGSATSAPYAWSVPLTAADNGSLVFTARAFDAAGNGATSNMVDVTVAIPVPDTTPPTVSLASSASSVVAPATVTLTATAADDVGVSSVLFYEGSTLLVTKTSPPYTHDIGYTTAQAGTHVYTAKAFDAAGNNTTSATLNVQVSLPAPSDRFVDPAAGADANDGLSLATAYKTITMAASTVSAGSTIWLAAGSYAPEAGGSTSSLVAIPAGRTVRALVDGSATLRFGLSFAAGGAVRGLVFAGASSFTDQTGIEASGGTVTLAAVRFANLGCSTCGPGGFGARAAIRALGNAQVVLDAGAGNPVVFDTGVGNAVLAFDTAVLTVNGGRIAPGDSCNGDDCTAQMKAAGSAQLTLNDMLLPLKPPATSVLGPQPLLLAQGSAVVKINRATITQAATPANPRDLAVVNGAASFTLADSTVSGSFHNLVGLQSGTPTIAFSGVTATSTHTGQGAVARTYFFVDAVPTVTVANSSFQLGLISGIGVTAVLSLDNGGDVDIAGSSFTGNVNALYFGGTAAYTVKLRDNSFSGNATCARPGCFTVRMEGGATSSFDLGMAVRPGGNSFVAASAGTGLVVKTHSSVTVTAVGNTWAAGAQGADATGQYKFGTAPCGANSCTVSTGSGQNFVWQSGALKLSGP